MNALITFVEACVRIPGQSREIFEDASENDRKRRLVDGGESFRGGWGTVILHRNINWNNSQRCIKMKEQITSAVVFLTCVVRQAMTSPNPLVVNSSVAAMSSALIM